LLYLSELSKLSFFVIIFLKRGGLSFFFYM
jgi:hypothetical protein